MTFVPFVPFQGNAAWSFLSKTREAQQEAFNRSTAVSNSVDYFKEKIGQVSSASDLMSDRRLLSVALGAFGLSDDIDNKFFIEKVLAEGTLDPNSLANRLSDRRYKELASSFGFDLVPPNTLLRSFSDRIVELYQRRSFEVAVGDVSPEIRVALSLEREIEGITSQPISDDAAWFTILSTPPLRAVFEAAFGFPSSFGGLPIDRQLEEIKDRASRILGTSEIASLQDGTTQEILVRRYLLQTESSGPSGGTVPGSVALSLLQSSTVSLR